MERKRNAKEAAYSSRDEDVFDFPGVEDEGSGNGPVAREAYLALKEGNYQHTFYMIQNSAGTKDKAMFVCERDPHHQDRFYIVPHSYIPKGY